MKVEQGKGKTQYGPGVSIHLTGDEVARAIMAHLVAHGIFVSGPQTIRVNKELCVEGSIYVDPSGFVVANGVKMLGRGEKIMTRYRIKTDKYNIIIQEFRPPRLKDDGEMTQPKWVTYGFFGTWEDVARRVLRDEIILPDGELAEQLQQLPAAIDAAVQRIIDEKDFFEFELGKGRK